MKFAYEDLLSGDPIFVEGIGHFRSPKLEELKPSRLGIALYQKFLQCILINKEDFLGNLSERQRQLFMANNQLDLFDITIKLKPTFRKLFKLSMDFFMLEKLVWDDKENCFWTYRQNGDLENPTYEKVGRIDRTNFEEVRDMAAQMNYINLSKHSQQKFESEKARMLWERTQEKMRQLGKGMGDKSMQIGNLISKICALGIGYTFDNIYNLTIYQFYDLFMEIGHLRVSDLGEKIYSNHGGKQFKFEDWLKPITNI